MGVASDRGVRSDVQHRRNSRIRRRLQRTGLGTHGPAAANQRGKPGYEGHLNNRVETVAEVLRDAGYRTMLAGKWHLGNRDPATWPRGRRFEDSFALLNGGASHWDKSPLFPSKPTVFVEGKTPVEELPADFYSSDFFTDKIIGYIESTEKPFFAFLSFTAPHNPLHAPAALIDKYKDTYADGWDALRRRDSAVDRSSRTSDQAADTSRLASHALQG